MRPIKEIESSAQRYFVRSQLDERERANAQELTRTIKNDGRLLKPTLIRATGKFCVGGHPVPIGSTVTVPWHVAQDMIALRKADAL
ncbi:MAG: hypothetical protein ACREJN_16240 [Nitrospiraceae bacterium]